MDTLYSAYSRVINGTNFYFVKRFSTFPEFKDVPDILESYGMHPDFKKACKIAQVSDPSVVKNLWSDIDATGSFNAKVIHMNSQSIRAAQ